MFLQGEEFLTCYTYNTHQAKHMFCRVCGVQSFYTPRSNPDGKAVTIYCLDHGTVLSTTVTFFDGKNWEKSMEADPSIKDRSKPWFIMWCQIQLRVVMMKDDAGASATIYSTALNVIAHLFLVSRVIIKLIWLWLCS